MRLATLDLLAQCQGDLLESKETIKQLTKVKEEYILYTQIIKVKFPRQHEGVLTELEASRKKLKEKTEEIRN